MAVPRNRHSNSRKNTRRAHMALTPKNLSKCPSCGAVRASHSVCSSCGHYRGRQMATSSATDSE